MRVYWPRRCLASIDNDEADLIGWRNSSHDVVVGSAVINSDESWNKQTSRDAAKHFTVNGVEPSIVGIFHEHGRTKRKRRGLIYIHRTPSGLQVEPEGEIILYDPPNSLWMHYLSLRPIQLHRIPAVQNDLVGRIEKHCVAPPADAHQYGEILEASIAQINIVRALTKYLNNYDEWSSAHTPAAIYRTAFFKHFFVVHVASLRTFTGACVTLLASKPLDKLATAQQLRLRLKRIARVPDQWLAARSAGRNEEYILLNNSLWLASNDVILGLYMGQLIRYHSTILSTALASVNMRMYNFMMTMVLWLMAWPAGFKLNTQLARFFGEILIWVILAWHRVLELIATPVAIQVLLSVLIYAGYIGATLQLAIVSDILNLITMYLSCFYLASARIYRGQLLLLGALFRVFRGKKWNLLRRRVDTGNYDLAQLLIGTILFIVSLFLFPTVAVFYAAFASVRLVSVLSAAALEVCLAILNHFPLFPLLLRLKSPGRVPGGVCFTRIGDSTLELSSRAIATSTLFAQYSSAFKHLSSHYLSGPFISGLLTGNCVSGDRAELYSILDSMAPQRSIPLSDIRSHLESL